MNFQGKRYQTINENFKHLLLSLRAIEAEVVIDLPKVKSHVQLLLTLGTKNLFGCIPGKMKAWWHMQAGKNMGINFPLLHPETLKVANWHLPKDFVPIDFGLPRVIKSTFRHLYIRFIRESINSYDGN